MTTGALIFAFNNESIDYLSIAAWSAKNIHRHLAIPVCVVTDQNNVPDVFDEVRFVSPHPTDAKRYFDDIDQSVTWRNHDRVSAFDLSPWDQTLLLDADYVVASDYLGTILKSQSEFLCYDQARDITGINDFTSLNQFGRHGMPMWWATVMMFRKGQQSRYIFDIMHMVRENWQHYKDLFGIGRSTYRNDYALSIALSVVSGHTLNVPAIAGSLPTVMVQHKLSQIDADEYRVDYTGPDKRNRYIQYRDIDFHAMCKGHLGAIVANHC